MASAIPEEPAPYPAGYPGAVVAGTVASLNLFISGTPVPQGRPRFRVITGSGRKPFAQVYPEVKTREWEELVADQLQRQITLIPVEGEGRDFVLPFKSRVLMSLRFNLRKPVSYPASVVDHVKKPDLDNLAKSVLDGMVKGRIIEDDNLITDLSISKRYVEDGHPEGVEITMTAFGVDTNGGSFFGPSGSGGVQ